MCCVNSGPRLIGSPFGSGPDARVMCIFGEAKRRGGRVCVWGGWGGG